MLIVPPDWMNNTCGGKRRRRRKKNWGCVCMVSNSRCTPLRFINAAAFTGIFNTPPPTPNECASLFEAFTSLSGT